MVTDPPADRRSHASLGPSVAVAEVSDRTPRLMSDEPPRLHGMEWPLFDLRLSIEDVVLRR